MALTGYSTKQEVVIQGTYIDTTVANCPVPLTGDSLSTDIFSAMQSDGRDLRFSSDALGNTELPREIQYIDTALEEIIVHVKIDAMIASTNKTIYAWSGNITASEPAPRGSSGFQSVWQGCFNGDTSYYGVTHLQNTPTSGTLFPSDTGFKAGTETSGNWTAINNEGNITEGAGTGALTGQNSWILDDSDNIINLEAIDTNSSSNTVAFYLEFWIKAGSYPNSNAPIFVGDFNRYLKWDSSGKVKFGDSGNASSNGIILNQWNQVILSRTAAGNVTFGLNGNVNGTTSTTQDLENMNRMFQDRNSSGNSYSGAELAWIRIFRGSFPDVDHIGVQWEAVDNAALFATIGTITVVPSSTLIDIKVLDEDTNPIELANVYVDEDFSDPQIMNIPTDVNGDASGSYTGANVTATLRVRKYGYKAFKTPLSLQGIDIAQTVTMIADPQQS